jgi:ABC-type lipopolysaccharide export system ATPase subunit
MGYIILIWDKQRMVTMEKKEITAKINTLIEMLYIVGQKKGLTEAGDIFTHRTEAVETKTAIESSSSVVMGSDPHPTVPPIKPVDIKSITIELEDNQIVLKLGGEVRNKHVTPSAETKFTQLLMLIKDQFSNWNANNGKDN